MEQITLTEIVAEAFAICVLIILVMVAVSITLTVTDAITQPICDYLKKTVTHYLDKRWKERRNG